MVEKICKKTGGYYVKKKIKNMIWTYVIIAVLLLAAELVYFRIADYFNIIDKPNERSSHSTIVLRGGGIIFVFGVWIWSLFFGFQYPWFLIAVTLAAGISFVDDIHSLPDSVRLVCHFTAMFLLFYQIGLLQPELWWLAVLGILLCVGATNIINFMDGINGITGAYAIASLIPSIMVNRRLHCLEESFLWVALLSVLVFCFFNFRPRGKAKCFAGDVGSVGIAFILLFPIGRMIMATMDITYLTFLVVYGVDGCLTIIHRIMLHENLGQAHRKHAYQIMANELGMNHMTVSAIYMALQLIISVGFVMLPDTLLAHWAYFFVIFIILCIMYVTFMKKYYHLHEEYLASLKS